MGEMAQFSRALLLLCRILVRTLYPHGGSQPSVVPVPEDQYLPLAFEGTRHAHSAHTNMQAKHSCTQNKHKSLKKKKE